MTKRKSTKVQTTFITYT